VAHFVLGAIALVAIIYIIWLCWSAFVPFQIGLVLAYITLPLVNRMSKVMPRGLATILVMLGELALVLLFVGLWIPLVVQEVTNIVNAIPSREELRAFYLDLSTRVSTFPEPVQEFIRDWANQFTTQIRDNMVAITGQVLNAALGAVLGVVVTITFFLSLLVLPTWLFSVLNGTPRMRRSAEQALPPLVRRDVWGVGRIVDRTLSLYLRGMVVSAFLVTVATYTGLVALEFAGFENIRYKLLLAMLTGLAQLIPTFGPVLGLLPVLIVGTTQSWEAGLATLGLYLVVQLLHRRVVEPRLHGRAVNLNPAVLAIVLVAGSQFGLIGVLIAAPLTVIVRDLYRYAYGRTSDPPTPAGAIPGERAFEARRTAGQPTSQVTTTQRARVRPPISIAAATPPER
jgi:predicted PurR-regulated permease PerM